LVLLSGMKTNSWKQYADADVLGRVTVRLIRDDEKTAWDQLITERHYLHNAWLVGRQLRYVAELDGNWIALIGWSTPAYHLKGREQWIDWSIEQLLKRRKFVVQNSRYLLLVERGQYPNLASRVLSLCTRQLSREWETAFGYPVLVAESFVDPQFFSGHCYRAAGWEAAGATQGCRRHHRDFYQEDGTPKELWLRALHPKARKWLKAEEMPERFARHEDEAQHCPYKAKDFRSLWEHYIKVNDPRRANGRLYVLAGVLSICTLAVLCGCRGTRAIADFAEHLGQPQRRLLRCYWNRKTKKYDAPSEPTIRRILKEVSADEFDKEVMAWQAEHDPQPLRRLAVDGKTVKQARAADGRALHLVAAVSPDSGRLCAQRPVDEKSNEITALRPMLEPLVLDGVVVTADAMQAQQKAGHFITHEKGGDYLFTLKGNQPTVQEKASVLLSSAFPPSGSAAGADRG
jgi:hypothetical protein